jgi:hypothetical protein
VAHTNKVMKSINAVDGSRCVDVFLRPDATYGFEEFRRDTEDASGWFPIGFYGEQVFASEREALDTAKVSVKWLESTGPAQRP